MLVGDTEMLVPVPTKVPPQLPVYHFQAVALFNDPVLMLSVVEFPYATDVLVAEIVGVVALVQTVID